MCVICIIKEGVSDFSTWFSVHSLYTMYLNPYSIVCMCTWLVKYIYSEYCVHCLVLLQNRVHMSHKSWKARVLVPSMYMYMYLCLDLSQEWVSILGIQGYPNVHTHVYCRPIRASIQNTLLHTLTQVPFMVCVHLKLIPSSYHRNPGIFWHWHPSCYGICTCIYIPGMNEYPRNPGILQHTGGTLLVTYAS